jgi:hypothetical protein
MAENETALLMVKQRLDMMPGINARDDYLDMRIKAAEGELERMGIHLDESNTADLMLLVDYVAWSFSNRDKPGGVPEWLKRRLRERWIKPEEAQT